MSQDHPGIYLPTSDPNVYESTHLANAGWYEEGQHGGALAALIAGHVETLGTLAPMEIARMTVELYRVVPLIPLRLQTQVVREGKRIQVVRVEVLGGDQTKLAEASIHRLRTEVVSLPDAAEPPPLTLPSPDDCEPLALHAWGVGEKGKLMLHRHAVEVREIHGGFSIPGPGALWLRLTKPVVAGRTNTAVQRAVTVSDFCNGIANALGRGWVFMNSDLTVHLGRYPTSEWVALDAEAAYSHRGRGVAVGTLWDEAGWVGRSAQTLFIDRVDKVD